MTLYVEKLAKHHDRRAFRCGRQELDEWFHRHAGQAHRRRGSARVWVLCDDELDAGRRPIGYYALVAHHFLPAEAPSGLSRGLPPRFPIGAALLARLAVDIDHQGHGLGRRLLADAAQRVAAADENVAMPLLVVDAIDEAAAHFYENLHFVRFPHDRLRLAAQLTVLRKRMT